MNELMMLVPLIRQKNSSDTDTPLFPLEN